MIQKKNTDQDNLMEDYSALVRIISDAIISTDTHYIITEWNKNAELILGYTSNEAVGKNLFQLLEIDAIQEQPTSIIDDLLNNQLWRGELVWRHKRINPLNLEMALTFVCNKQGSQIGTISILRDITLLKKKQQSPETMTLQAETDVISKMNELTKANEELLATRERFYLISNATNESIWDWEIATNKIWGNQAYLKLLDKTEGDCIDYMDFVERVPKEDNDKIAELFQNAVLHKKTNFNTQFNFKHSDGSLRQFINRSYIIYDNDGNPIRCLGGLTDITAAYQAQQQILKEKELSDSLINSLPGVFYIFNKEGKYLRWNKNMLAVSGYSEEELRNMKPLDFVPDENKDILLEKIYSVFFNGSDSVESLFLTKEGRKIPYYFTGSYIKINGEDCLMGVGYDMTEKLMYQQQLKELANHLRNIREEEQSRISREIHDELGQQLTGIKLQLSLLKKQCEKGEKILTDHLKELIELTDETLSSTRRIAIQLRPSILDDLGLIPAMEWLIDDVKKKYKTTIVFKTHVQDIELDPTLSSSLYRIFQESMTNIIRHSKATTINISLDVSDDLISMAVSDNGIGFDIQSLQGGKSLGILGMKERAEMNGAFLEVYSRQEEGTKIIFRKKLNPEKSSP